MRVVPSLLLPAAALLAATAPLSAQGYPESVQRSLDACRDDRDGRARACEVRALAAPRGTPALHIEGGTNGGVRVVAWERDSIAVFALVQTWADEDEEARALAGDVAVTVSNGRVRASEPARARRAGTAVSYQVFAPRAMDVTARTHNGGIRVDGMAGRTDVEAENGGLSMRDVGGDLRGRTRNGSVRLTLSGSRWQGRGADLQTTNGSVTVDIPERFDAELEVGTVNGPLSTDVPITVQGRIGRELRTTLGDGGPTVRVRTTNGAVRIRR